ncbi:MAG: 50S ribosomal protein L15 [Planctomycetota bacterium]|nr:50S ribosomal protein L15 [Planctomycetota bacterium]
MSLDNILSADTGRKFSRRVGRGSGSGVGKTCGRGQKGAGARAGNNAKSPTFEGGQFPFWQRLPKRGFSNYRHTTRYQAVSLGRAVKRIEGDVIDLESMIAAGLADQGELIKLVSGEAIDRKVTVKVHKVTASVKQAVEAAGGSVEELNG